jgi:hypothetical protein
MRCALVCLLAGVTAAADAPLPEAMVVKAGGGGALSLRPDAPSQLNGGVDLQYGGVRVRCESLVVTRAPYPGSSEAILSDADIGAGPHGPQGPDGPWIELDTRRVTLPKVAFRGLLTPGQVHVSRLAADPLHPKLVRFAVTMIPLGAFSGELRQRGQWRPYRGWAERAEAEVEGDITPAGIQNLRLASMVMHGRPAQGEQPAARVWIDGPPPQAAALPGGGQAVAKAHAEARTFTFTFADNGDFLELVPGPDFTMMDLPAEGPATAPAAQP